MMTGLKTKLPKHEDSIAPKRVEHALIHHKLTLMRDTECSTSKFRSLMNEISLIMCVEATRDLPIIWAKPLHSDVEGDQLKGPKPIIVAVLRAGLGMSDAFLELMPSARVGHIGLHPSREAGLIQYLIALPDTKKGGQQRVCFIVDPVIGTGNVACRAIEIVKKQEVPSKNIRYVTIVAAREGLSNVAQNHPDVHVYFADEAEGLDANLHVLPHWGDASNKLFGIK